MYLIECQGSWEDGLPHSCDFYHYGEWGDKQLNKHQKEHEKLCNQKTYFWSGFERSLVKRERTKSG